MALEAGSRINHVSESAYGPSGHGVETAFHELVAAQRRLGCEVHTNAGGREGVLHTHTIGPIAAFRLARHKGLKVATAHVTPESLVGSIRGERLSRDATRRYMRSIYSAADVVLAVSREVQRELQDLGVRAPMELLPNGIDPAPFEPTRERREKARMALHIQPHEFVVLGVGQLQPRKGVEDFIACARGMPQARFLWVGSSIFGCLSAQRGRLHQMVRHPPVNVSFVGQIPRADVPQFYHAADTFLLPSRHETFGLAAVEAAMAGLPLVLRDIAAVRNVFGHREGVLGAATNVKGFMDEIESIRTSPMLRALRGEAARRASIKYSAATVAAQSLQIYAETIKSQARLRARW